MGIRASVEQCIARQREWEPRLKAFAWFDAESVREAAAQADEIGVRPDRPLHGVPVGVKDIFDTAGIPTEFGSVAFRGRVPAKDAAAVSLLKSAGAIIFGKTVTAELAYYTPGPTTNPWNPERTPGGSSMGSAAAVAAGIIPAAIGTQTNGSVIRPAAFCGVVGFKPSAGSISTDGVMTFSRSLDQVGVFAQSVSEAALLASAIAPGRVSQTETRSGAPRLVIAHIPEWQEAQAAARASFDESVASARNAGADVIEKALPPELADALPIHRTIMAAEAHQFIGPLVAHARDLISERLRALLDEGATTSARDYADALEMQRRLRTLWTEFIADGDALLTLPALGEAPDLATTGDPRCCTRWTLVGAPAITIPTGFGPSGLPLGVQLVGRVNRDAELISTAAWFESVAGAELQPAQSRRVH